MTPPKKNVYGDVVDIFIFILRLSVEFSQSKMTKTAYQVDFLP